MQKVSEVQITPIKPKDGLLGFASLVLYEAFYVGSIGVYRKLNSDGFRITYPNRNVGTTSLDIFHPLNRDISKDIEVAIFKKAEEIFDFK